MSRLLEVSDLRKSFPGRLSILGRTRDVVRAVDGVSFHLDAGETLGLVGESGSGKSTVGRSIVRLIEPDGGQVLFHGTDLATLPPKKMREARQHVQMVFQDPYASLDPMRTVAHSVGEPLVIYKKFRGAALNAKVESLLTQVGLSPEHAWRYPSELSGGQRQRVSIARALALDPSLIVADEAVSALDVSIQSEVLNLLRKLQRERGLAYLFISHDLSVVRYMSARIAVMYFGRIVEIGPARAVHDTPTHPYTKALLSAVLEPNPKRQAAARRVRLSGEVPDPAQERVGCSFAARCPEVMPVCREVDPALLAHGSDVAVACHLANPPTTKV